VDTKVVTQLKSWGQGGGESKSGISPSEILERGMKIEEKNKI
jgi:hypothetical protein